MTPTTAELLAEVTAAFSAVAPSEDYRRVARVHFWMGRCHWYRNAYPEAIGYYQRTLAAAQILGDDELTARSRNGRHRAKCPCAIITRPIVPAGSAVSSSSPRICAAASVRW